MSVYEARQWTLDTVFICGLAEKAFPKRHAQDAFLPDAAMEKLKRAGFAVSASADLDAEEEELFRLVRASAQEQSGAELCGGTEGWASECSGARLQKKCMCRSKCGLPFGLDVPHARQTSADRGSRVDGLDGGATAYVFGDGP